MTYVFEPNDVRMIKLPKNASFVFKFCDFLVVVLHCFILKPRKHLQNYNKNFLL